VSFAGEIGRPLDTFITINFGLTMTNEEQMVAAFRRLVKSFFGKWFTRHPAHRTAAERALTYAWVAEGRKGHHGIHWLVYIPQDLKTEFALLLQQWIERTAGPIIDPAAIQVKFAWRPAGAAKYMLKGLKPHHARRFGIEPSPQGEVFGKRCGVSENLGPTAIKRHRQQAIINAKFA
jgi:hypothetical protein